MPQKAQSSAITGDVVAMADVRINTKGGSLTATLKKAVRDKLGNLGDHLSAATVEFATGQAILLLSGGSGATGVNLPVHVRKIGKNRFEIGLEADSDEEVDEVTAAFLRLKRDQFEKGRLRLSEPVTADDWRAAMDEKIGTAEAAMKKAGAKTRAK